MIDDYEKIMDKILRQAPQLKQVKAIKQSSQPVALAYPYRTIRQYYPADFRSDRTSSTSHINSRKETEWDDQRDLRSAHGDQVTSCRG